MDVLLTFSCALQCIHQNGIEKISSQPSLEPSEEEASTTSASASFPAPDPEESATSISSKSRISLPEPWSTGWDPVRSKISMTATKASEILDGQGFVDFTGLLSGIPADKHLTTLEFSGILSLKTIAFPQARVFERLSTLNIVNTRLTSTPTLFTTIAEAMPVLRELDLSGSMLTHVDGVADVIGIGLRRLCLQGGRIENLDGLVEVATKVREGMWTSEMRLEELDLRDNAVEKLPRVLGFIPVNIFLVDGNAFLAPPRRVWEKEGSKGLLQWLMDRAE